MSGDDADLSINISGSENFLKRKTKRGRFYGNKNFRNPNRERYLGKNRRPTRINTSTVKIPDHRIDTHEEENKKGDATDSVSTALHFKAVDVTLIPKEKARKRFDKARIQSVKRKAPHTKNASREGQSPSDKSQPASFKPGPITGPWKSSLFNQNPDIPKVIQPDVIEIKEAVFSVEKFSDLDIHPHLLSCIEKKLHLSNMTAIQQKAISVLLSGQDALIKSQTGSGKTLAYAIPIIQKLQKIKPQVTRKDGPVAMLLTPTRELALQSYDIFSKLTMPFCRIVPTWIIGGENRKSEKSRIRKGVNVLIGTPGRILDHIQTTESLSLKNLRWLIFDEADRLLDMGFQQQIDAILTAVKEQAEHKVQKVLVSATLSEKVERLATLALDDPAHIHISNVDYDSGISNDDNEESFALPDKLTQHVAIVPSKLRLVCLVTFLKAKQSLNSDCKILVFLSCRDSVEFHYLLLKHVLRRPKIYADFNVPFEVDLAESELEDDGIFELHGGMTQKERQHVFNIFSSTNSGILLTTDVSARGLDLPSVDWVIQYTSPGSPVDYIHRVGRTARAGKKGNALLMLTPAEVKYISLLTQFNIHVNEMSVDDVLVSLRGGSAKTRRNQEAWEKTVAMAKSDATSLQNQIESYVSKTVKIKTYARTAYMSFIRAYASYPTEIKSIFHVKHLHLGHVAKCFGLQDAPKDIVKTLSRSVGQLPVKTSFEYREAKKEAEKSEKDPEIEKTQPEVEDKVFPKPRLSRKRIMKNKMSRMPDVMSEFSSGLNTTVVPIKKAKR